MAVAQFLLAVGEETDQSPVDVAEAEEAEVVDADRDGLAQGLKPRFNLRDFRGA
jgi:hypothetical protein